MTDLGFGLVDKRSVVIILFVFTLSSILIGNPIPVDTSNAGNAFIGFGLLTGFIYGGRVTLRIFISLVYTLIHLPIDFFGFYNYIHRTPKEENDALIFDEVKTIRLHTKGFRGFLKILWVSFIDTWITLWALLFKHMNWGDGKEKLSPHFMKFYKDWRMLGIADRLCLVLVSYLATMPTMNSYLKLLGTIGIVLLIAVYTIRGSFTFILKDVLPPLENRD